VKNALLAGAGVKEQLHPIGVQVPSFRSGEREDVAHWGSIPRVLRYVDYLACINLMFGGQRTLRINVESVSLCRRAREIESG